MRAIVASLVVAALWSGCVGAANEMSVPASAPRVEPGVAPIEWAGFIGPSACVPFGPGSCIGFVLDDGSYHEETGSFSKGALELSWEPAAPIFNELQIWVGQYEDCDDCDAVDEGFLTGASPLVIDLSEIPTGVAILAFAVSPTVGCQNDPVVNYCITSVEQSFVLSGTLTRAE